MRARTRDAQMFDAPMPLFMRAAQQRARRLLMRYLRDPLCCRAARVYVPMLRVCADVFRSRRVPTVTMSAARLRIRARRRYARYAAHAAPPWRAPLSTPAR